MCLKGVLVVHIVSNSRKVSGLIKGGGNVGWLYVLLIIISMVWLTGTLVKRLSTSKDARLPVACVPLNTAINSYVDFKTNFRGIYCTMIRFNCLDNS